MRRDNRRLLSSWHYKKQSLFAYGNPVPPTQSDDHQYGYINWTLRRDNKYRYQRNEYTDIRVKVEETDKEAEEASLDPEEEELEDAGDAEEEEEEEAEGGSEEEPEEAEDEEYDSDQWEQWYLEHPEDRPTC